MNTHSKFHLSDESIRILCSFNGSHWRFATGEPLAEKPRHYFSWNDVVVATDRGEFRINTSLSESDFEGYAEEYAQLAVYPDAKGLAEAQANGHIYFQHAGEQITKVFVFRVGITQIIDGVPTWVYSADHAVIFGLTEGAVAVCKTGHHSAAIDLSFADSVETLELDGRAHEWDWENELGEEYNVVTELIQIGETHTR